MTLDVATERFSLNFQKKYSIIKLPRQFQTCLIFSCKKVLSAQKHSQAKINRQSKIKETLNKKDNNFSRTQKLLRGWKSLVLRFGAFLGLKTFSQNKNRLAWNCLETSLYYTTIIMSKFTGLLKVKKNKVKTLKISEAKAAIYEAAVQEAAV